MKEFSLLPNKKITLFLLHILEQKLVLEAETAEDHQYLYTCNENRKRSFLFISAISAYSDSYRGSAH